MNNQNVLAHHGIKGMKWGVRRTPEQLGHTSRKKSSKFSIKISKGEKSKESSKFSKSTEEQSKKKKVKDMSDDDLRRAINRIEMERKYVQLTTPQKSKGRKIVEDILSKSAMNTATKYTTKAMDKMVDSLLKSMGGSSGGGGP